MDKDSGILNELQEISPGIYPVLKRIRENGHGSFKVPEGYFDELQNAVFTHIESGLAEGLGKSSANFNVPEQYFETLTGNIMNRIEALESEKGGAGSVEAKVVDLQVARRREPLPVRRWTVMAASVALFVSLGILAARFIGVQDSPEAPPMAAGSITQEEVLDYLQENIQYPAAGINSDDLLALVNLGSESATLDISEELEEELHLYLEENIDYVDEYLLTGEI